MEGEKRGGSLPRMPGQGPILQMGKMRPPQETDLSTATPGQSCPRGGTNHPQA